MKTMIKTYDNDIYIIDGKSPEEVMLETANLDYIQMPNGSIIAKKSISAYQTYEDYQFQTEQRIRHKKGQFIRRGNWNDDVGVVANAELDRITGTIIKRIA